MTSLRPRNALVAATVLSTLFLFACAKRVVDQIPNTDTDKTEAAPTGSGGGSKTSSGGGDTSTSDSGTTTKKPTPKDPPKDDPNPTGGGQCASETTFDTCLDCCVTAHPDGSDTFYGTYINCLCGGSVCGNECSASLCDTTNPTNPDAACDACIQANGNSCQGPVSTACSADPDCVAFDTCVGDSQCSTKP